MLENDVTVVMKIILAIQRYLAENVQNVLVIKILISHNQEIVTAKLANVSSVFTIRQVSHVKYVNPDSMEMHWNIHVHNVYVMNWELIQDLLRAMLNPDNVHVYPM